MSGLVTIRPVCATDAPALLDLQLRNRSFLAPFDPARPETFYTLQGQRESALIAEADHEAGRTYAFVMLEARSGELAGRIALSNVVRGAWQNATLGYFVDEARNGRGYASEAVRLVLGFAFRTADLHRVQAAVMPRNAASARVLEKTGFRKEGFSPRYLEIAGTWEDHEVFGVTCEEWGDP